MRQSDDVQKASGARVEASRGVGITPVCHNARELKFDKKMQNKPEPDNTIDPALRDQADTVGAVAQLSEAKAGGKSQNGKRGKQINKHPWTRQCQRCNNEITQYGSGRPRKYCCKPPKKQRKRMPFNELKDPYSSPEYKQNRRIILSQNPDCHYCGKPNANTIDHVIELDAGGDHSLSNLVPACAECNNRKGHAYVSRRNALRLNARHEAMRQQGIINIDNSIFCDKGLGTDRKSTRLNSSH